MQEKRRARGLEADLESLQKQLRLAQTRMAEQVNALCCCVSLHCCILLIEQSETIQRLNGSSTSATSELSNTLVSRECEGTLRSVTVVCL